MFIRKYYKTRIGRAMLTAFLLLLIPLIAVSGTMAALSSSSIHTAMIQNYANLLEASASQFGDRLRDMYQLTISLTVDDELNALSISEGGRADLFSYVSMQSRLRAYATQRQMKCDISLWLPRQGWIISTNRYVYQATGDADARFANAARQQKWGIYERQDVPDENCLSIASGYVHNQQSNPVFYIEISEDEIVRALSSFLRSDEIRAVFLADREGIVYGDAQSDIDMGALCQKLPMVELFSEEALRANVCQYSYNKDPILALMLPGTNCVMGILLNNALISRPNTMIMVWMLIFLGVFLIVAALYTIITYQQIVRPIHDLNDAMERVGQGDFSLSATQHACNELGDIEASLNRMSSQLRELIEEKYIRETQLAQTQLRVLRAQINPHFLYNCLFTLYTFIKNEDLDSAADLAIYLGQYYQINTRADNGNVQLYRELDHIRLLVQIQNMRFAGRITYLEDIEESTKLMSIPNLTLLTVAENFLTHGIKDLRGPATLTIRTARVDGEILLTVADTGMGVSDEQLASMCASLEQARVDDSGIHGLMNVLIRFRELYGEAVRITVAANEPRGLIVQVRIPA